MENDNARSVSEVVNAIKVSLEYEYSDLTIVGEITNLSSSAAGHYYFTSVSYTHLTLPTTPYV